jgi:hypothetical protein
MCWTIALAVVWHGGTSPIESFLIHSRNIPFFVLRTGHSAIINVVLVFPKNLRNAEPEFDCQWELSENAIRTQSDLAKGFAL